MFSSERPNLIRTCYRHTNICWGFFKSRIGKSTISRRRTKQEEGSQKKEVKLFYFLISLFDSVSFSAIGSVSFCVIGSVSISAIGSVSFSTIGSVSFSVIASVSISAIGSVSLVITCKISVICSVRRK